MVRSTRRRRTGLTLLMAVAGAAIVAPGPAAAIDPPSTMLGSIDVDAATIPDLQAAMDAGDLTSEQLVSFYLERIEVLEPSVNAIIALNEGALDDARAADAARASGTDLPLLGIPVLIKDNINTTGLPTTAGSYALKDSMPPDAFLVTRLRDAGAIILGKANLSEWANIRAFPSSSGWSAVGGQTANPYALDRNPCGSSSGSAAAVAASLATVAVGTETDGSIVCPASAVGVVGIKPSVGVVSRSGIVPISPAQDTAGPLARNVTDAAILLAAMEGVDPADPAMADAADAEPRDLLTGLDASALQGARIGVWREGNWGLNPPVDAIMDATIERMKAAGATIVDPADLVLDIAYENEYPALLCEFKAAIADYLATLEPGLPKTLQELIEFNVANAELELQHFGQETFEEAQAAPALDDPACVAARASATAAARTAIDSVLAASDLDAIIAPTGEPAWLTDLVAGDAFIGPYSAPPAAVAGYPTITLPVGSISGLPVGMSFIGGDRSEARLIALAYALEQALDVRVPPTFPASVVFEGFTPPVASPAPADGASADPGSSTQP